MPWIEFKKILFDLLDNRILNSPEIHGYLNTSYLDLSEYLLIYMIDKYKTRTRAESMLCEFLITLRFYSDIFLRAKLLATLL